MQDQPSRPGELPVTPRQAQPPAVQTRPGAAGRGVNRLTEIIGPMMRERGLDVREVAGTGQQIRELVITNPEFPHWGRVVVDREGLTSWDYWGETGTDDAASRLAAVITALIASNPGEDGNRYPRPGRTTGPGKPARAEP